MQDLKSRFSAELVIEAAWVIPVEPHGAVLENHAVAISDGNIVALLPRDEMNLRCSAGQTCQLDSHVLIPGLINFHSHAAMTLMRGLADDLNLRNWLSKHTWQRET